MNKTKRNLFLLLTCLFALCCGCISPERTRDGNSQTIFQEPPKDNSLFSQMDNVTLTGYYTYHYGDSGNLIQTNYYTKRDTDDGTWGWHERRFCTYDSKGRLLTEQLFLPYVDNEVPWTTNTFTYFQEGYSEIFTYNDGKTIESYYDTDGNLLLKTDSAHHANTYDYTYEYDMDKGTTEEYLKIGRGSPFLNRGQYSSGNNTKIEVKYTASGYPDVLWINTYNENGERISGDWCRADVLPANVTQETYVNYCQPGYRTNYENGRLIETTRQEWDINTDCTRTTYTLYDYDASGNLSLKLTYDKIYNTRLELSRYEYDDGGRLARRYDYRISPDANRDWNLLLSDGAIFRFAMDSDQNITLKRVSATDETLSMLQFKGDRLHIQYIGEQRIDWK